MAEIIRTPKKIRKLEYRVRFDGKGNVLGASLNAALGEELGIALHEEEPPALTIFQYVQRLAALAPDLPKRLDAHLHALINDNEEFSVHGDYTIGNRDYHVHISGRAVLYRNGDVRYTLLFLDDTAHTNLRRLYEYMFRLANHELKGPIACILGAVEFAESSYKEGNMDGIKGCLDMIDRNAQAINEMILRYLNLSRIESGNFKLDPADILFSDDVLNPIVAEMQPALHAKGMTTEFVCQNMDHESVIVADDEKLGIVIRNLLSNAIKYGLPNSIIYITLAALENNVEVSVENAGENIPEHYIKKLFRKFVRLDATQGTKGSGLGLYNARKIVELWGGAIRVESSDNKTRFTFSIPQE